MSEMIVSIAAEADKSEQAGRHEAMSLRRSKAGPRMADLPAHSSPDLNSALLTARENQNPHPVSANCAETRVGHPGSGAPEPLGQAGDTHEEERRRRTYRGRTVAMLRRYMRYSIETGRLPSLLGREFFRSKVTSYTVVTFEDRVIFVHDMETCLSRLDEFSRQIIARHILQEHDQAETGRLLNCAERTVRTYVPMVLDLLSDILVEVGLLAPIAGEASRSCQEGGSERISVSDCNCGKNKV
jgi:hypothetical protein